jgi:tol-pal system protein YbgF
VIGKRNLFFAVVAATLWSVAAPSVLAQSTIPIEDRLSRLETMLNSGALIELLQRVEALQHEVQALRGELEEQTHAVSQLKKRQRELYLDTDRRIEKIETSGVQVTENNTGAAISAADTTNTGGAAIDSAAVDSSVINDNGIDPIAEQDAYQTAFNLLKTGQYKEAGTAFQTFIADYGQGKYADNAQYWLSETYYVRQQFEEAVNQFRLLTTSFPNSAKFPHALLKIGYSQAELGRNDEAKQTFAELISKFPHSTAARNAEKRLQKL